MSALFFSGKYIRSHFLLTVTGRHFLSVLHCNFTSCLSASSGAGDREVADRFRGF